MSPLEQKLIKLSYELLPNHPISPGDYSDRLRHFTFLVHRNRIINISFNDVRKTHPTSKKHGYRYANIHSEIAMLNATNRIYRNDYRKLKVYNIRINNHNQISMAKPCMNCQGVLGMFNFKAIYYTNKYGVFEQMN